MKYCIIEKEFDYKDYHCVCTFNRMGFRCGYVGVSTTHPCYGVDYLTGEPNEIDCHWGLTYSGDGSNFGSTDNLWYFGFGCGHYMDGTEVDLAKEYGLVEERQYLVLKEFEDAHKDLGYIVKDLHFVEENCKMIAEQLDRVI